MGPSLKAPLAAHSMLRLLNLNRNPLGLEGIRGVVEGLRDSSVIFKLSLGTSPSRAFSRPASLFFLLLSLNETQADDAVASLIANFMTTNKSLKELQYVSERPPFPTFFASHPLTRHIAALAPTKLGLREPRPSLVP